MAGFSNTVRLAMRFVTARSVCGRTQRLPTTPIAQRPQALTRVRFGLHPFRSPLLGVSPSISFPPVTEMFHFAGYPPGKCQVTRVCRAGFPHSGIRGSKPACSSPRLIAACHALHRPLVPRHPPCAPNYLVLKLLFSSMFPMRFSRFYIGSRESLTYIFSLERR